jgi:UbiD family decarboxylase
VGATRASHEVDEFHLAGALRQNPVEMVKCKTIDIEVPAMAEWVFEGVMHPGVRHHEETEWFGEYTGHYGEARELPVFECKLITHRNNPIYHGTREQWYPGESFFANGRTSQAEAYRTLKKLVPGIVDMRCNVAYEAIVKIKKLFAGHPQQVMDAVWGATYAKYKHVIVVDEDVDIWDYESVHWALSTRVKADRDVTIAPRRSGQWLDPAASLKERGWQCGMGIDATMPTEEYEFWGDPVPKTVDDPEMVEKIIAKYGKGLKDLK